MDFIAPHLIALAMLVALGAGVVKGMTGFAMPMILISGLGSFLAPELALAGLVLPTLVTNLWQGLRDGLGAAWASVRAHWKFLAALVPTLIVGAQLVPLLPTKVFFLCLGVPITVFAVVQLAGWQPRIRAAARRATELSVGALAGLLGGLSGVWGPPTVLYLTALDTPKNEQMRVQGVVYALGSVLFTAAHIRSGIFSGDGVILSVLLVLAAVPGVWLGFRFLDMIDQSVFRKITLAVLVFAGLNLIRRGLMGEI